MLKDLSHDIFYFFGGRVKSSDNIFPRGVNRDVTLTQIVKRLAHNSGSFLPGTLLILVPCRARKWLEERELRAGQSLQDLCLDRQGSDSESVQSAAGQAASADGSAHVEAFDRVCMKVQAPK